MVPDDGAKLDLYHEYFFFRNGKMIVNKRSWRYQQG